MKKFVLYNILFFLITTLFSQSNEFKIGVFEYKPKTKWVAGCQVYYTTPLDENGLNTSVLNVYVQDGFNIVQEYAPHEYSTIEQEKARLLLAFNHGILVSFGGGHYYFPTSITYLGQIPYGISTVDNHSSSGYNIYNNCGNNISNCISPVGASYFRTDIDKYINEVYSVWPYSEVIWGYHIAEEPEHFHAVLKGDPCQLVDALNWGTCETTGECNVDFCRLEVPPSNVSDAMSHYNSLLNSNGISHQKMVYMPALHHYSINDNTTDIQGVHHTPDYLQAIDPIDNAVVLEGSYVQFPSGFWDTNNSNWLDQEYDEMINGGGHYLGAFKSIDYIRETTTSDVHKVIAVYFNARDDDNNAIAVSGELTHYHSNPNIPNANWLWFQAYNSIIHGAKGIWFWGMGAGWTQNELNQQATNYPPGAALDYWKDETIQDRFQESNFPEYYKKYVSNLSRELRYLVDQNLISDDPSTVLYNKTDYADPYCIIPPANTYIPDSYDDPNLGEIDMNGGIFGGGEDHQNENYGLRYSIRTNSDKIIMIISNPLPIPIVNINLNFSSIPDPKIKDATGVWVLFENYQDIYANTYKVNREGDIDLDNATVGNKYYIPMSSNQFSMDFGPMDTKIIEFASTPPHSNPDGEWDKIFTNNYSGNMDGWTLGNIDYYYQGDFDGNGKEELLLVHNETTPNPWMTTLEFNGVDWIWKWSNYGHAHPMEPYRQKLIVGDYDGDGTDEILGNDIWGWTTLFRFDGSDFVWSWSDNGSHPIVPYKDNLVPGDFDGDGKDEILGCDFTGWTTIFEFNGSDFVWGWWSDFGASHPIQPYKHDLRAGDFDGDGKDELLGLDTWGTLFKYNGSDWDWLWSTYGSSSFSGWSYPLPSTDELLIGDLTNDKKDDLLFIQNGADAHWSTLMTLNTNPGSGWDWVWTGNNDYADPYINDWSINKDVAIHSRYMLLQARNQHVDHLLALRYFKLCTEYRYLANMYYYADDAVVSTEEIGGNIEPSTISVYPNPSHGTIEISILNSSSSVTTISIYNALGELVHKSIEAGGHIILDLSPLEAGVYLIRIETDEGFHNEKLIISE